MKGIRKVVNEKCRVFGCIGKLHKCLKIYVSSLKSMIRLQSFHIYPDGDAVGSIIGLRELIKTSYPHKEVFGLGSNVQPFVSIVGELDEVSDDFIKESAAIIVDVANGERVEDQRFKLAKASFKIDHHIFVEKFTDEELVLTKRIATAEIIGELMMKKASHK